MKIIENQKNSRMCIICGMENQLGVKAPFYNAEDDSVVSIFQFREEHQSYPGRVHGGMICAMLDELIGRALWIKELGTYAVTTSLTVKYRKPVPYGQTLKARGYILKNSTRLYTGRGEIYDMDDNLLAECEATYLKMPTQQISENADVDTEMSYSVEIPFDEISFPPKN